MQNDDSSQSFENSFLAPQYWHLENELLNERVIIHKQKGGDEFAIKNSDEP
jgi:hypothetical protein